jgi:serine phosphatase RsbU (regulator of sigma subunit)
VKEFLEDCGFQDVKYWKDSKQIDGFIYSEGEVTYHILIDFVEDKVLLEAIAETGEEYEDFQQETWQGLPDLYDTIIEMMKHYGIFQGLPPKPKWKRLKLQLTP